MYIKHFFFYSLIFVLLFACCSNKFVAIADIENLKNGIEVLKIMGNPHDINNNNGNKELIYYYNQINIFKFEKRTYYYNILIDKSGQIINKIATESIYRPLSFLTGFSNREFEMFAKQKGYGYSLDFGDLYTTEQIAAPDAEKTPRQ